MYKLVLENTGKGPLKALEESFNIFMYLLEPWSSLWPSSDQLTCRCDLVLVLDQSLCFVFFAKLEPASRGLLVTWSAMVAESVQVGSQSLSLGRQTVPFSGVDLS